MYVYLLRLASWSPSTPSNAGERQDFRQEDERDGKRSSTRKLSFPTTMSRSCGPSHGTVARGIITSHTTGRRSSAGLNPTLAGEYLKDAVLTAGVRDSYSPRLYINHIRSDIASTAVPLRLEPKPLQLSSAAVSSGRASDDLRAGPPLMANLSVSSGGDDKICPVCIQAFLPTWDRTPRCCSLSALADPSSVWESLAETMPPPTLNLRHDYL